MNDYSTLFQVVGTIALVVGPVIALDRWLAGADGPSLADLFAIPLDPPWPSGVQEDEPVPWRLEALTSVRAQRPAQATPRPHSLDTEAVDRLRRASCA